MMKKHTLFRLAVSAVSAALLALSASAVSGEPTLLWDFGEDEEMSAYMGGHTRNAVSYYGENDYYVFTAESGDPYVSIDIPADDAQDVVWAKVRVYNPSQATAIEFFASTMGRSLWGPECTHVDIEPFCEEWKTYIIYVPEANVETVQTCKDAQYYIDEYYWEGNVNYIRLDPMWCPDSTGRDVGGSMSYGDEIYIDYVAFFDNEEDAKAFRSEQDNPKFITEPEPVAEAVIDENEDDTLIEETAEKAVVIGEEENTNKLVVFLIAVGIFVFSAVGDLGYKKLKGAGIKPE